MLFHSGRHSFSRYPPLRQERELVTKDIVVMPGSARVYLPPLEAVAGTFGWAVSVTRDLCEVAAAQAQRKSVAVLFCRDTLGQGYSWLETIRLLGRALPEMPLIPCHGFSDPFYWPELCDAGAFHALWLPLRENEVRQSLGFVWEAEKRLAGSHVTPSEIAPASGLRTFQRLAHGRSGSLRHSSMTHTAR